MTFQQPAQYVPLAPPNNSLALAGFILGWIALGISVLIGFIPGSLTPLAILITFALAGVPGLLAIIFGFIGISTANRMQGRRRGKAIAAVILGFSPILGLFIGQFLSAAIIG